MTALLNKDDSVKVESFSTIEQQYSWIAQEIRKNIEHDELDPDDILIVLPNTLFKLKVNIRN
ncbi:hypothetical protein DW074_06460 [Ruminococcus sp. AF46-10NS]|nr:hypothetical protein [Ruminococcus sp. AF46-10NS]RHK24398.1 hypothetical protein DW074_06460 [Ruminococcus sp. AF46-10NS]